MSLTRRLWVISAVGLASTLLTACGGQQSAASTEALFETPAAELAKKLAPDLHRKAEAAWEASEAADRDGKDAAAADFQTEARLWLAAAANEAERIELDRQRLELQAEEERWAIRLGRDQEATAIVAQDISRYQARAIALREAERLSPVHEGSTSAEIVAAMITRARLNLAVAKALGAPSDVLTSFDVEASAIERQAPANAGRAERFLLDTEALVGTMRAEWPEPLPGAAAELVQTALAMGFEADRLNTGAIVRSGRFFTPSGRVSQSTVQRFVGLMSAFPHGPVACQVAVPQRARRAWPPRVATLVERLQRTDDPGRVSTGMVVTDSLAAGTVQCTFAAYGRP
ncbi:MAG: hypothetical protein AAGF92_06825 [Myxococcota bacterium]